MKKSSYLRRIFGFTTAELLVGTGISGVVLLAMVTGMSMLQQQFSASTQYADAQSDQMRVMDFIQMDLRRATAVTTAAGITPLTLTMPDFYQTVSGKKQARTPTKSGLGITYGPSPVTVTYSLQGNNLIRTEGGVAETIATTVQSFPTPVRTTNPDRLSVTLTFSYRMHLKSAPQTVALSSNILLRNLL